MDINVTLIGQMITFILFVWFTKQFVWPPVIRALKDRQAKIADGLAAAERGHVELAHAKEAATQAVNDSKNEAGRLVLEAKKQSDHILDQARQQAREEGQRIIQQAHAEIEHMIAEAKETLRKQIAGIVLVGAEKILESQINPALHQGLLDKLAQEI